MAQAFPPSPPARDPALVHEFIRVVGHRPTSEELRRYQGGRLKARVPLSARIRRGAAWLMMRP